MTALNFQTAIDIPLEDIKHLCERNHVRKMWLFGSVLRDDFRPDSDIDMLVEFESDAQITLLDLAHVSNEMERLLDRAVDLGTPDSLSKYIAQKVMDSAQIIYEQTIH